MRGEGLKCWLLRPWTSYGLGRRRSRPDPVPGPGRPPARPAVETNGTYEHIVQVAGRGRGKALRPQWATGSEGVQAGQDLAWGHSGGPDPGTGPGACLFSKPGTGAWVARTSAVQSTIPKPQALVCARQTSPSKKKILEPGVPAAVSPRRLSGQDSLVHR